MCSTASGLLCTNASIVGLYLFEVLNCSDSLASVTKLADKVLIISEMLSRFSSQSFVSIVSNILLYSECLLFISHFIQTNQCLRRFGKFQTMLTSKTAEFQMSCPNNYAPNAIAIKGIKIIVNSVFPINIETEFK